MIRKAIFIDELVCSCLAGMPRHYGLTPLLTVHPEMALFHNPPSASGQVSVSLWG